MSGLDWSTIEAAQIVRDPYDHFTVAQALEPSFAAAVAEEYPDIRDPGSFSLSDVPPGPLLQDLIADLKSDRFRAQMERIFEIDLSGRPVVVTLRGRCSAKDGQIHTDSKTKLLSLLLYLNPDWKGGDGQLRLLRNGDSLDNAPVEVPANLGTLLVFRRSDDSWHGHTKYVGVRRVLQLNYLQSERASLVGDLRHRISAIAKRWAA